MLKNLEGMNQCGPCRCTQAIFPAARGDSEGNRRTHLHYGGGQHTHVARLLFGSASLRPGQN